MRFTALLLIPSLALAAPLPKNEVPSVEVKLAAKSSSVLNITVHNNGREPLKLPYHSTPLEHIAIDMRGDSGTQYTLRFPVDDEDKGRSETLTIEPGKSKTFTVHTCHSMPELGNPQKVTFKSSLKIEKRTYTSEPLTVGQGDDDGGPLGTAR